MADAIKKFILTAITVAVIMYIINHVQFLDKIINK